MLLVAMTFSKKKNKIKKESLGQFKMIYSSFVLETVLLTLNYTTNKDYAGFQSPRLNMIFLFWVIVIFFATDDPFLERLLKRGLQFIKNESK